MRLCNFPDGQIYGRALHTIWGILFFDPVAADALTFRMLIISL